jgi:sulfur carrier protein
MQLFINGQLQQTNVTFLAELLQELNFDVSAVACAIDGNFIPRHLHSSTALCAGQKIEVLAPMQGG